MNAELDTAGDSVSALIRHVGSFKGVYGPLDTLSTDLSRASSTLQEKGYEALDLLSDDLVSDAYQSDPDFANRGQQTLSDTLAVCLRIYGYLIDVQAEFHNYLLAPIIGGSTKARRKPTSDVYPVLEAGRTVEPEDD